MNDGHTPTEIVLDEMKHAHAVAEAKRIREAEEAARRRRVALMLPLTGYRHMGRRRKRDLTDLRLVLGPGLVEAREQEQARRRLIRGERKANPPVEVDLDLDVPKGWAQAMMEAVSKAHAPDVDAEKTVS